jgi:nitrate/nitrite transport system ATP-binding protein
MTTKPLIRIEGLAKRFPEPSGKGELTVFENLWFTVDPGEFVCIVGHSGCGKSTILNILAGLDKPSEGVVIVGEQEVNGPSLDRAVIFQSHALMPWLSAQRNIELGVASRHRDWSRAQIREHAGRYLDLVHLAGAEHKKPAQLSGGMRQRVGIARAMAVEPKIMLMDEPFSALDALTRGSLQDEVLAIRRETKQTIFMITHDVDEAMLLADKIVLMTNGPRARIAEVVENTLPTDRERTELHKHPNYYPLRNHLIEFLVTRSKELAGGAGSDGIDPTNPPVIRPIAGGPVHASTQSAGQPAPGQPAGTSRLAPVSTGRASVA